MAKKRKPPAQPGQDWSARAAELPGDRAELLAPYEWLSDGNNLWRVHEPHGLFGVKRVPRSANAPLRSYIDALAAAHAGAQPSMTG